jgi:hypothetical protein
MKKKHPPSSQPPQPLPTIKNFSGFQREELKALQGELKSRRLEALRLYRPTPQQSEYHECLASETLVIGGNRSGKSLCTFIEDAWAATGTHPVEGKYPKEGGNLVIVGANWKHIGLVVVPYLFRAGAFKIIKDRASGEWRAFDPMLLGDKEREAQAKPAPPLIPPRMIKSMSWLLKSAGYLNSCELVNGWTIYCFSSEGDPPQGFQADRVHLDEDLNNEQWVPEMQARLADRKGRFTWSAMPHSKNEALIGLNERAEKAENIGDTKDIRRFVLRFLDNPHIDADEKRKMLERWAALGEDVLRQRSEGEFMTDSMLVYPSFNMSVHGYSRDELPAGQVPDDWCRYAIVDPGHSVTAVLFAAVPPQGHMVLCYDELYIRECNAIKFAKEFQAKVGNQQFYAFLIDSHGGRLTDIGSGRSPQEQYSEQLRELGISSEVTGSSFIPGCDEVQAGLQAVRNMLYIRPEGTSKLRFLRGALPNMEREMKRYKKKVQYVAGTTIVTDEPNKRGEFHLVDCLRYLCAYNPMYHEPPKALGDQPWWVKWVEERRKKKGADAVYLAPATSTGNYG